jgi:hypothetical protein
LNVTVDSPRRGPATNVGPNRRSCALAHRARSAYARFLAVSVHTGLILKIAFAILPFSNAFGE